MSKFSLIIGIKRNFSKNPKYLRAALISNDLEISEFYVEPKIIIRTISLNTNSFNKIIFEDKESYVKFLELLDLNADRQITLRLEKEKIIQIRN